jgi:hypothetical protein
MYLLGIVFYKGPLLRLPRIPPLAEAAYRLLFPPGSQENMGPFVQELCKGMETIAQMTGLSGVTSYVRAASLAME